MIFIIVSIFSEWWRNPGKIYGETSPEPNSEDKITDAWKTKLLLPVIRKKLGKEKSYLIVEDRWSRDVVFVK